MDIKTDELKAFIELVSKKNFTRASEALGLTQSALSQKIAKLEQTLQVSLIIRNGREIEITSEGEDFLLYAKQAITLQQEYLKDLNQFGDKLAGVVKIAGFSSVMRSIIMPKLSSLIIENQDVNIELSSHEMNTLASKLKSSQVNFIITDYSLSMPGTNEIEIFQEEYVIIESNKVHSPKNIYLDHNPQDNATHSYFSALEMKKNYTRRYVGDTYSIIDAVKMGLGRAVMSKHLIQDDKKIKIINKKKKYKRSVFLTYKKQSYYGSLQKRIIQIFS